MADSWIVTELARRMLELGAAAPSPEAPWAGWRYPSASAVMAEIGALTPSYAGVTYDRLNAGEQLHWPVRDAGHPGTPVLHAGKFVRGLGRFVPSEHLPPAELPDDEYPLMLTTGRVIYHWHGAEMTRRARGLNAVYPEALIEVSPKDAQAAGVKDGDLITLGLAARRDRCQGAGDAARRRGAGVRHVPLPGFGGQLPDQPGPGSAGEDPGVQSVCSAAK